MPCPAPWTRSLRAPVNMKVKLQDGDCVEAATSKAEVLAPRPKSAAMILTPCDRQTPRGREREFFAGDLHFGTVTPLDRDRDLSVRKELIMEGTPPATNRQGPSPPES